MDTTEDIIQGKDTTQTEGRPRQAWLVITGLSCVLGLGAITAFCRLCDTAYAAVNH